MLREESSKKKRRHPPDIKINLLPRLVTTQGQKGMTKVALKASRGICFEDVVFFIERGEILDDYLHPNQKVYPGQRINHGIERVQLRISRTLC